MICLVSSHTTIILYIDYVSHLRYNRDTMQNRSAMIRARTQPNLKKKAENILRMLGISPSDAINIFYNQIVLHKGIPFDVTLDSDDSDEFYTEIKDKEHLKSMLNV